MEKPRLTIICPVCNEQATVPIFFERIKPVLEKLGESYRCDLVFTNNASTDGTVEQIEAITRDHPNVYLITISKNVGYQASLECGLRTAQGDVFVFIDVDCEDPPEMIPDFVHWYEQGYDIVYGERIDRDEPRQIMLARKGFYRVLKALADDEVILDMAEFSLLAGHVREAIVKDHTSFPFIRASIGRVGFKRKNLPYKRHKRAAGVTHFRFLGMAHFAIAGILSSSTLFLRLPIYILPFWLLAVMALAVGRIYTANPWLDAAILFLVLAYFGSAISFIAIYVGRTYKNSLGRPNFVIDNKRSILQSEHYAG
ncbi:MAG: glycosyltransferase family 2 protein [Cyanobacteria bacterium REEB67]|nr:glycosyltransferase family 2 protein [Cyanobacteria bacterium REEB67]